MTRETDVRGGVHVVVVAILVVVSSGALTSAAVSPASVNGIDAGTTAARSAGTPAVAFTDPGVTPASVAGDAASTPAAAPRTNESDTSPVAVPPVAASHRTGTSPPPYTADVVPHQPDIRWGGRAVAVDVHPSDDDRAIVASESGGLFETTDGGASWTHLDGRYPHRLNDVKYAPSAPGVIILAADSDSRNLEIAGREVSGGGIWRSPDGGHTWNKSATAEPPSGSGCNPTPNVEATSIAFEPGTANVYVGTECGLAVSTDLGGTWTHEPIDGANRKVVSVVSPAGNTVDVCTDGTGHFRYRPAVDTWEATAQQLPARSCTWNAPHSLAASPADPDVLFAVVAVTDPALVNDSVNECKNGKRELFESDDGGQTWTDLNVPGCSTNRVPFVATSPVVSNEQFFIFAGKGVQTYRTVCTTTDSPHCSDDPDDWEKVDVSHVDGNDVAFPADDPCPVFMTDDGGVETTTDCGRTWDMVGSSGPNGFNALQLYTIEGRIFEQPDHTDLYFGTQDNGQWAGERRGLAWTEGPGNEGGWMGLARRAVAHGGEPIMIEAENNHYEASDRNLSVIRDWRNPPPGGAGSKIGGQAYYLEPGTYLQWGGGRGERKLWLTTNTGGDWRERVRGTGASIRDLVITGPASDPTVYNAVTEDVFKITDVRASGSTTVTSVGADVDPAKHVRGEGTFDWNTVIAGDPDDPAFLLMPDEDDDEVKVSRDGGASWQAEPDLTRVVTDNGRFEMDPRGKTGTQASEIDFDPDNTSRIFVGTEANGVVASFDGGQTWGRVPGSQRIPAVSGFFFDDRTGGDGFRDVYVASYGRGLWKIDDVRKLQPLPAPDSHEPNDDPSTAVSIVARPHTAHFRCPDVFSGLLGGRGPGDDCSDVLTDPDVDPTDFTSGAPLAAKEEWGFTLANRSLDGPDDVDFYRLPDVPDPTTHSPIGSLPNPECGTQTVTMGGEDKRVTTTGYLSIVVRATGNSLSRTPVRVAGSATPINVYDLSGRRLNIGTTTTDGNKIVHTLPCPHANGYRDLIVSFGEGSAANSGAYTLEYRYRIDIRRPDDTAQVFEQLREVQRIAENAGRYEQLGELFSCQPVSGSGLCVYRLEHPFVGDLGEEDFCERAICRVPWEFGRIDERAFETTVLGNENLELELQRVVDGEVIATSRAVACLSPASFERVLAASGHGATVREAGVETLIGGMGEGCGGTRFGQQAVTTSSTPAGAAPVRHRLSVDSLEPGLYRLVISGPPGPYWLESFTPSAWTRDERDPASRPRASFEATPVEAVTDESVTMDASASIDPDGEIVRYRWRFGDDRRRVTTRAATVTHTYRERGEYPVTLTVTDEDGNSARVTREVFVSPAPAGGTGVSLEPARQTTGDCPVVVDNRFPGESDPIGVVGEESATVGEEGFEEGLPCTVYDPATPLVDADGAIRYDVVVEDANTGVGAAGFTVELTDGAAADITAVSLGPHVDTGRPADVQVPADAVTVTAESLDDLLGDARGRTVLATVTVRAADSGSTGLTLSDTVLRNPGGDAYTITGETGAALRIDGVADPPGPSVRFDPPAQPVELGDTATVDVVVTDVDGGVGSFDVSIALSDASRVRILAVDSRIGGVSRVDLAEDGSRVRLAAFAGDTADTGTVTVATVIFAGIEPGDVVLAVDVSSVADEAGEQYEIVGSVDATVTVREEIRAPEVVVGRPSLDLDGDGVYEDVNGDGDVTPGDATVLFNAVFERNAAVVDNVVLFDVNGDGSVTAGDATVLFDRAFAA